MIMDIKTAEYIAAVVRALTEDNLSPDARRSNQCPECEQWLGFFNTDYHIVYNASTENDPENMIVVVGCEGYWAIDPKLVGIRDTGWMSPEEIIGTPRGRNCR
jgi:hypothetical protein